MSFFLLTAENCWLPRITFLLFGSIDLCGEINSHFFDRYKPLISPRDFPLLNKVT